MRPPKTHNKRLKGLTTPAAVKDYGFRLNEVRIHDPRTTSFRTSVFYRPAKDAYTEIDLFSWSRILRIPARSQNAINRRLKSPMLSPKSKAPIFTPVIRRRRGNYRCVLRIAGTYLETDPGLPLVFGFQCHRRPALQHVRPSEDHPAPQIQNLLEFNARDQDSYFTRCCLRPDA